MCIVGQCRVVWAGSNSSSPPRGSLPESCFSGSWPDVASCANWSTNGTTRVLESNNVPAYVIPPYCPFGVGQGYCRSPTRGHSSNCTAFAGRTCPCVATNTTSCPHNTTSAGDVVTPVYQRFEFPLNPDPTDPSKPKHMYNHSALRTGNTFQVIGAMNNGVQIKGPADINGVNVDVSLIPLPCGGHVEAPLESTGSGVYHYHKAPDCLNTLSEAGSHAPLVGYAADGFGIYGFGDFNGEPVLDECNGHFGPTPPDYSFSYHYHVSAVYNLPGQPHRPYFLGCLGPSKGQCNATRSSVWDGGASWCGQGCGSQLCAQPGVTSDSDLQSYLDTFTGGRGQAWLANWTINDF